MKTPGRSKNFSVFSFAALVATIAFGCKRPHVDGTVAVDSVLAAWGAAGLDTKAVINLEPDAWTAGACSRGLVAGLDVLICEYPGDDTLATGEQKIMSDWEEESVATAAVVRTSRTLLAVADRNKADPNGRTIARLVKIFREQK
jgi:hypothetical protein